MAASIDKMELLKNTPSPKIVFVGGSNLAYGLDSALIKEAFSIPVVNMGLQRGLGLEFMFNQVNPYLNRGDIVVIVPEYMLLTGDKSYYDLYYMIQAAALTNNWRSLANKPVIEIADALLKNNKAVFFYGSDIDTSRYGFNKEGDETAHLTLPNSNSLNIDDHEDTVNLVTIKQIYNFMTENSGRGIITLVIYPCLENNYYIQHASTIAAIAENLNNQGIKVLSKPQDFVYDKAYFYNSIYHLNSQGRKLRTNKIIQVLNGALVVKSNNNAISN
jgi:hypothetical protein